jgi:hypothetical protein
MHRHLRCLSEKAREVAPPRLVRSPSPPALQRRLSALSLHPARRRDRDFEAHHQHACPRQPRGRLRHRGEFWLAAGASALFGSTLFSFELNMVAPSTSRIASPAASTTPISTVFSVPVLRVLPSTGLSGIVRLHAPRLDACTTVPTSRGSKIRAIKACRTTRLRPIAPTLRRSTALGQAVACKMC